MLFKISEAEFAKRNRNLLWGAGFSLLLAVVTTIGHNLYPDTFNKAFYGSVLVFLVLANLINFLRHLRYLKRARLHRLEVVDGRVRFFTDDEMSQLDPDQVAGLTVYRRKGEIAHLQVRLKNNRGIRLEGYEGMEPLRDALAELVPAAHVDDKTA
jgi:hypothetical protein